MKAYFMASPVLAIVLAVLLSMSWADTPAARGQSPQPVRQAIDVSKLGPQVGQRVPDFSLTDQTGRTRILQSIMGPRGAMLVFLRSADW